MKKLIIFLLLILAISPLYSNNIDNLAESNEWHNLLLDNPNGKDFITDYSKMFACGRQDYKAEIEYLINNQSQELYNKYPARYECINRNLDMNIPYLENNPELQAYLEENDYDKLSIALAEPINERLMSLFGHAILILSKDGENIGDGVNINLFAHLDDMGGFEVIKNGLTGNLVGYFDFEKAHLLFENYSIKLNREVIVFETNLTEHEIRKILLMLWEMRTAPIDYHFVKRNCVNGVLALLDYGVGDIDLISQTPTIIVPNSLVKLLRDNNYIVRSQTYSPASMQFGLEVSRDRFDEFEKRKTFWTHDGWKNEDVVRDLEDYIPVSDQYNRPFYLDNRFAYLDIIGNYNFNTPADLTYNLETRFLSLDPWERTFSSTRKTKFLIGKMNLHYNSSNDFGLNEFILWEKVTYNKIKYYNKELSGGLKLAADNKFNDNKLKPYVSISKGLGFGISSLVDVPNDPLLVYIVGEGDVVFDYARLNLGVNSGILLSNPRGMIHFDTYFSLANFPYDKNRMRSNRVNLSARVRVVKGLSIGAQYEFLNKKLSASIRYAFSPFGY